MARVDSPSARLRGSDAITPAHAATIQADAEATVAAAGAAHTLTG